MRNDGYFGDRYKEERYDSIVLDRLIVLLDKARVNNLIKEVLRWEK